MFASVSIGAPAKPQYGAWGFDATGMDTSAKPGDDFFKYANGGWDARTEIPADRTGYGVDFVTADNAELHLRGILEAAPTPAGGADAQKIHAAYLAFMDEAKAQALGAAPIAPDLAAIRAAKDRSDIAALMGQANVGFQSELFDADLDPDEKDPGHYAVYIGQRGLGLPDRDYYLTPAFAEKKQAYQAYVAQMLTLAGWADPAANAAAIVDYETKVAEASWTRVERRDPVKTYNPMTPAELAAAAPGFDWSAWLKAEGLGDAKRVVVQENTAFPKLAAIYAATPLTTLQAWAAFHVADNAAPFLDHSVRGRALRLPPTPAAGAEGRAAALEARGRLHRRGHGRGARARLCGAVLSAGRQGEDRRSGRSSCARRWDDGSTAWTWMSAETKAKAHAKLDQFTVKIAYPDKWRDYSALTVSSDDLVGDARAFRAFEWNRQLKRMYGPVDRSEWGMTPQTVNAYYDGVQNEIVFPAAILLAARLRPQRRPGGQLRRDRRNDRPRDDAWLRRRRPQVRRERPPRRLVDEGRRGQVRSRGRQTERPVRHLLAVPRRAREGRPDDRREHRRPRRHADRARRLSRLAARPAGAGDRRPHRRPALLPRPTRSRGATSGARTRCAA